MTRSYYDAHAKEYAELTVKADMSPAYDRFWRISLPARAFWMRAAAAGVTVCVL